MKNKKILVLFLIFIIGTVGTTVAYFKQSQKVSNEITSDEYAMSYNYEFIKDSSWNPGDYDYPNINITNEGEIPVIVRAKLSDTWTDENGNNINLKLYNGETAVVKTINTDWFKDGNYYYYYKTLNNSEKTSSIIDTIIYNSNTNNNVNCDTSGNCTANNDYANATYKLNISFETIQVDAAKKEWGIDLTSPKSLKELMLQQSIYDDITSPTVTDYIKLNTVSSNTNGNGIFTYNKTVNDTNSYVYYRGNVNNNVIFAGHCWKIISITDNGSIKMIYNGNIDNGTCQSTGDDSGITISKFNDNYNEAKYTGYMYQTTSVNDTDSKVKKEIDLWYENNLITYNNYLSDTKFLGERDGEVGDGFPFAFVGRIRIWGNNNLGHAYNVPNTYIRLGTPYIDDVYTTSSSLGNGKLKYPIALLTTDEAVLAGERGIISSTDLGDNYDNFLTCGSLYWLMSPAEKYYDFATMTFISQNGSLGGSLSVASDFLVRPVIALKSDIKYSSGNGTITNPYIISE